MNLLNIIRTLSGVDQKDPYNKAIKVFHKIRDLENGSSIYDATVTEVITLAKLAIARSQVHGDAHVLLANAYFVKALASTDKPKMYIKNLTYAAAVIGECMHNVRMYTKERAHAQKLYNGVLENLTRDWPDWMNITIEETDIATITATHYQNAVQIVEEPNEPSAHQSLLIEEETETLDDEAVEVTHKVCPFCAEDIKAQAIVCRYCGRDLPDD